VSAGRSLEGVLEWTSGAVERALEETTPALEAREVGRVLSIDQGVAWVSGLPSVRSEELLVLGSGPKGAPSGLAFDLRADRIGVVLLDDPRLLEAGARVERTGRVLDVPVGEALLGRVVDALGRPLDDGGPVRTGERRAVEQEAPAIMDRAPVAEPLQTGIRVVDALIPIGRGQRELITGDRQTGKTTIAVDTILAQRDADVVCVYCTIGQRKSSLAKLLEVLRRHGALDYTAVVAAGGEEPPGLQFVAPYAATSMAEHFMLQGRDVLVVYDDLTRHARAYRELSLLLRRPPGREAYPGDIFYIHSRLLERATHLRDELGGGSLTALPVVETQAQNISAYIPTNLISITDGQIYVSPRLQQKGVLPAVDVGRSVSRVGGRAQRSAYRAVAGELRLAYAQFEELEDFARFGTRLDDSTRHTLERGRRVREVLKQPQHRPQPVSHQLAVLLAAIEGLLDPIPAEQVREATEAILSALSERLERLGERIATGAGLDEEEREELLAAMREVLREVREEGAWRASKP
jgi:F-type H+/Na+-transporting ATPase subunit alpha